VLFINAQMSTCDVYEFQPPTFPTDLRLSTTRRVCTDNTATYTIKSHKRTIHWYNITALIKFIANMTQAR